MLIGIRLKELRSERGISADQLAAELQIGVAMVFRYENNKSDPSSDVLTRIARYFKVSTDYLVGLAVNPNPYEHSTYIEHEWPSRNELLLTEATRKGDFEEAAKLLIQMHEAWMEQNISQWTGKSANFNFDDDFSISSKDKK